MQTANRCFAVHQHLLSQAKIPHRSVPYTLDENEFNQRTAFLLSLPLFISPFVPFNFRPSDLEPNDLPSEKLVLANHPRHALHRYVTRSPAGGIIPDKQVSNLIETNFAEAGDGGGKGRAAFKWDCWPLDNDLQRFRNFR